MEQYKIQHSLLQAVNSNEKRHFLFLQGPVGPFFKELGQNLASVGHKVTRINFNAGDWFDWHDTNTISYKDKPEYFITYLKQLHNEKGFTDLFVYGDCRPLHKKAINALKKYGVSVHVFEEGYIRPSYVTYEKDGVNHFSQLPRSEHYYTKQAEMLKSHEPQKPLQIPATSINIYVYAAIYYIASFLGTPFYSHYKSHRKVPHYKEGPAYVLRWLTSLNRKKQAFIAQKKLYLKRKKFYLALLQLCGDSQIQHHSNFNNMFEYIETIIQNFARYAPKHSKLVFKNHPLDNGLGQLKKYTLKKAKEYNVGSRVMFIDGGRLKGLSQLAAGVITINSTAAFSALHHGTPTIALGEAIYNFEGLTFQGPLKKFWKQGEPADIKIYKAFRAVLTHKTQVNGNYYNADGRELIRLSIAQRLKDKTTSHNSTTRHKTNLVSSPKEAQRAQ